MQLAEWERNGWLQAHKPSRAERRFAISSQSPIAICTMRESTASPRTGGLESRITRR